MIIIIGNQKGGAGKSTLAMLLANYLTEVKKARVTIVDMDYQQSVSEKYQKAKILMNPEPYQVLAADLEEFPRLVTTMKKNAAHVVIIDLPGKLDDDGLMPVFEAADLVICPFSYDEFSFESTILFSVVLRQVNPQSIICYVPNRIKANVRYDILSDVNEQLHKFGQVSGILPDRIDFSRTNTRMTPLSLRPIVDPVFNEIFGDYNFK